MSRAALVCRILCLFAVLALPVSQQRETHASSTNEGMLVLSYPPGQAGLNPRSVRAGQEIASTLWRLSPLGDAHTIYKLAYTGTSVQAMDPGYLMVGAVAESRDGRSIAYAAFSEGVWLMRADGSGRVRVLPAMDPAFSTDYGLGFTPDGAVLAWYACCMEHEVGIIQHGRLMPLLRGDDPFAMVFQDWLPGGAGLLFSHFGADSSFDALFSTDGRGGALRPYPFPEQLAATIWQARFSPDGRSLLVAYSPRPGGTPGSDVTIAVVNLKTLQHRTLIQGAADNLGSPTWSPDGTRIAYLACPNTRETGCPAHDVWLMDADGTHRHDVTHGALGDVRAVTWRPGALFALPSATTPWMP